jgi:hypothetical protein
MYLQTLRINKKISNLQMRTEEMIENKHSATAWKLSPKWSLYASVVTSSLGDMFYETAESRLERFRALIGESVFDTS